jgi:hypothetical protein
MQSIILNAFLALSTAFGVSVAAPKISEHMEKKQAKLEHRADEEHGKANGVHKQLAKIKAEQASASQPAAKAHPKMDKLEHKSEVKAKVDLKKDLRIKSDLKIEKKEAHEKAEKEERHEKHEPKGHAKKPADKMDH